MAGRPKQRLGLGPFRVDSRLSRPATNGQGEFRAKRSRSVRSDPLEHNFRMGIVCATALEGDYALAAGLAQRVVEKNPEVTWAYRHIIAYSALAGDLVTARDAIGRLRAANPGVAVTMSTSHPLRSVSRLYDVLAQGWRLAGLLEEN